MQIRNNYILSGQSEASRLDDQTSNLNYSLESELSFLDIATNARILDAGCGSGVLCRYLESKIKNSNIAGCDLGLGSLEYARERSSRTTYFQHDIVNEPLKENYDFIFNRLVAHHLNEEQLRKVISHFYKALSPMGEVVFIDLDGLFMNVGTLNSELRKMILKVNESFHGNLFLARMIPSLLKEAGFKNIDWKIDLLDFVGDSRKQEVLQWKERFENSISFYEKIFASTSDARKFFKLYIEEISRDDVPLFYNKFIVRAKKY